MKTDILRPAPGVRVTRIKARVHKAPDPMPPWRDTMLIAKPHRKTAGKWLWRAHRNHSFLSYEERAEYARGDLLIIAVPDYMRDAMLAEMMVLVPEGMR